MRATSRNRILMLLENCGYPRDDRVRREAKSLVAAGYHVTVISPKYNQSWSENVEGVQVYRFLEPQEAQGFLGYLWEYAFSMIEIGFMTLYVLIKEGFDILHAHHPPDTFVFIAAFYKLLGKKYVLDHHDLAPELYYARFKGIGNPFIYKVLVLLEKFSCRLADQVIATNQSYKQVEIERGHVAESKITIVRNGPDLHELSPSAPDLELRKRAAIIIGYVGVMGIQDGVDNLLKALQKLICDFDKTDFLCVLVGDGAAVPGLKKMTKELNLSDHVLFTGWVSHQDEIASYLSSMDICVAPEPSDPYNDRSTAAKIMEYMTFAKPIVAFDLPEHRFTAQDAALYAQANNIKNFAEMISYLIDNAELRKKVGENGRKRLINELAWTHQEKALLEMYKKTFS